MTIVRSSALRQAVAAILLAVLTLSGVGRALALADAVPNAAASVAGITVEICHTGAGTPSGPVDPSHHDCCDTCTLCAPVSLPGGAPFAAPARVAHFAEHADAVTWAPAVARIPTPRLSQGPPAA